MKIKKKDKWVAQFGISIFLGKDKIDEITFKNEKDMMFWLYQNGTVRI